MPETHAVRPGQIYESCQPVRSESPHRIGSRYVRIKVISVPATYGTPKVQVATLTDGRAIRHRALEISQLHASGTTRSGEPRRTGYRLVQDAPESVTVIEED